jgi:hypothetical protein
LRFFEEIKDNEYEYAYQAQHVAFSKMLGFDDDEHLEEWISENPQWCDDSLAFYFSFVVLCLLALQNPELTGLVLGYKIMRCYRQGSYKHRAVQLMKRV